MTEELTTKTVRGLKWTYVAMGTNMVLQVLLTAAMARILTPDSYGLVAMCYTVVKFGTYFAQLGIAPALIRRPTLTAADIDTAFCTSCMASLCLFSVVWVAAPSLAVVFDDSRVVPLIHIAACSFLIGSFAVVAQALLRRDMRFGAIGAIEILSFLLGPLAVGLPLAMLGFGAESIVWGFVAQSFVVSALTYTMCGHSFRLRFDRAAFQELFTFGGKHSFISFVEFLTYTVDVFLIAQILGAKALGLYNRATYLIQIPAQALNNAVTKVAYPALSAANSDDARFTRAYLTTFLLVGMILFPVGFGISVAATELVAVVLGNQWTEAAQILRLLAIAVPFHLMMHVHGLAFDVKAALGRKLTIRLAHLAAMTVLYLALARFGLIGFALAFLIVEAGFYVLYTIFVSRMLAIEGGVFADCHRIVFVTAAVTGLGIFGATELLHLTGAPPGLTLFLQIATGAAMLGAQVVLFPAERFGADLLGRLQTGFSPDAASASRATLQRFLAWYMRRLQRRAMAAQAHASSIS